MPFATTPAWFSPRLFWFIPWFILALGLVLTWLLRTQVSDQEGMAEQEEFELRITEITSGLHQRLQEYAQILRGVDGLFASSEEVTRDEFHRYVEMLQLARTYPGIQGIGYTLLVEPDDKGRFVALVRAQGLPDYDIRPPGKRGLYSAVLYLEPPDWRNQRVLGYDLLTDPVRAATAACARDENQVALSDPLTLIQETDQGVQVGFLVFLPDYRPGLPLETSTQRRAALRGWSYAAIRLQDLMQSFLSGEFPDISQRIALEIHGGEPGGTVRLLYASNLPAVTEPPHHVGERLMSIGGQDWFIRIGALP